MASLTRIANKTQWSLQDTLVVLRRMERQLEHAIGRAEYKHDPLAMLELMRIQVDIAKAQRIQRAALRGEYEEEDRENYAGK